MVVRTVGGKEGCRLSDMQAARGIDTGSGAGMATALRPGRRPGRGPNSWSVGTNSHARRPQIGLLRSGCRPVHVKCSSSAWGLAPKQPHAVLLHFD